MVSSSTVQEPVTRIKYPSPTNARDGAVRAPECPQYAFAVRRVLKDRGAQFRRFLGRPAGRGLGAASRGALPR